MLTAFRTYVQLPFGMMMLYSVALCSAAQAQQDETSHDIRAVDNIQFDANKARGVKNQSIAKNLQINNHLELTRQTREPSKNAELPNNFCSPLMGEIAVFHSKQ